MSAFSISGDKKSTKLISKAVSKSEVRRLSQLFLISFKVFNLSAKLSLF